MIVELNSEFKHGTDLEQTAESGSNKLGLTLFIYYKYFTCTLSCEPLFIYVLSFFHLSLITDRPK
jgi:hypothetical protein